jgi:hypothetical protein
MSLIKVLVVEHENDPESEGLVLDRLVEFKDGEPLVLLGVHWLIEPKDIPATGALNYFDPSSLVTIDVIDDVSELNEEDEEEEEEEEEEGEDDK